MMLGTAGHLSGRIDARLRWKSDPQKVARFGRVSI